MRLVFGSPRRKEEGGIRTYGPGNVSGANRSLARPGRTRTLLVSPDDATRRDGPFWRQVAQKVTSPPAGRRARAGACVVAIVIIRIGPEIEPAWLSV